jgi:hypothetical protein
MLGSDWYPRYSAMYPVRTVSGTLVLNSASRPSQSPSMWLFLVESSVRTVWKLHSHDASPHHLAYKGVVMILNYWEQEFSKRIGVATCSALYWSDVSSASSLCKTLNIISSLQTSLREKMEKKSDARINLIAHRIAVMLEMKNPALYSSVIWRGVTIFF